MLPTTTKRPKSMTRKFTISDDDPFSKIFDKAAFEQELANPTVTKNKCKHHSKGVSFGSESGSLNDSEGDVQFFPKFDGTQDSKKYGDPLNSEGSQLEEETSQEDACCQKAYWKNAAYWRLPENVRNAIDVAQIKSKHTAFYYRLQTLNDKIFIYRSVFYSKMPAYQKAFLEKKREALEKKLKQERIKFEAEMTVMNKSIKRKLKSTKTLLPSNNMLLLKAQELSGSQVDQESPIKEGITAMEMVAGVRKRQSSKRLVTGDLLGSRRMPKRAASFNIGAPKRRVSSKDANGDKTPSTGDTQTRVNPRQNFGLTIKVDKAPDENEIKEAHESDEAQTPAEFMNHTRPSRRLRDRSNHSSPMPPGHTSLSGSSEGEHSLEDTVSNDNGTAQKSNRLISKEQLLQDLNRSPCLSAKGPRKQSSKKISFVSTPQASLKKDSKKNVVMTLEANQRRTIPAQSADNTHYFSERYQKSENNKYQNCSYQMTSQKQNQMKYRESIKSRVYKSIDQNCIKAKRMMYKGYQQGAGPSGHSSLFSSPLRQVPTGPRIGSDLSGGTHLNISSLKQNAPDPKNFPPIKNSTLVLKQSDINYSRSNHGVSNSKYSNTFSKLSDITKGLDMRLYHKNQSTENLKKNYHIPDTYEIVRGRITKQQQARSTVKKQKIKQQIFQTGTTMASQAYKIPATDMMLVFDSKKKSSIKTHKRGKTNQTSKTSIKMDSLGVVAMSSLQSQSQKKIKGTSYKKQYQNNFQQNGLIFQPNS